LTASPARQDGAPPIAPESRSPLYPRLWLGLALALLALRAVLLVFSVVGDNGFTGDEPYYDTLARGILATGTYDFQGEPSVHRPPGWPFTLAMIYRYVGETRAATVACQVVFDCVTILGTGWMAGRLFGSAVAGAVAFSIALVWPPFAREARLMQTEPLFTMLTTLMLVRFQAFLERPTVVRALWAGVFAGLSAYVRPTGLVIFAGMGLGWLVQTRGRALLRFPALIGLAAAVVLVVAPWTIRNYRVTGEFLPIAVGSGEQFFLGSLIETHGRWDRDLWWTARDGAVRDEEARLGRKLDAIERDHVWMEKGLEIWREHPVESVLITLKRLGRLIALPLGGEHRPWIRAGFLVTLFVLYLLALPVGLRGLRPGEHPLRFAGALLIMLAFYTVVSTLMYTSSRYFEPVRTAVIVMAAGPLSRWLDQAWLKR
jgi:4-amino-4-deoxy-L-arabinose transferase-like glycosyltransferase